MTSERGEQRVRRAGRTMRVYDVNSNYNRDPTVDIEYIDTPCQIGGLLVLLLFLLLGRRRRRRFRRV